MDLGTGDGRAVIERARLEPGALVIGIDAAAAGLADASRRAHRRGPANARFFAAGAATLAGTPVAGRADLVTVTFPWGSLLRGVIGLEVADLGGVASLLAPGARLEVLASVTPADRVDGLACLDAAARPAITAAWRAAGITLLTMTPATDDERRASHSSWARRLGPERPVWRLVGERAATR